MAQFQKRCEQQQQQQGEVLSTTSPAKQAVLARAEACQQLSDDAEHDTFTTVPPRQHHHNAYQKIATQLRDIAKTERLLTDMIPALTRFRRSKSSGWVTPGSSIDAVDDDRRDTDNNKDDDDGDNDHGSFTSGKAATTSISHDSVASSSGWRKGANAQTRLALAFVRLIKAIVVNSSVPVILFLDDLQWSKAAPLQILAELLKEPNLPGFMLLGACRENEVSLTGHLSVTLRELEAVGACITEITLNDSHEIDVYHMVHDTLMESTVNRKPNDQKHSQTLAEVNQESAEDGERPVDSVDLDCTKRLTNFVWKQTGRNFFSVQLLRKIQEQLGQPCACIKEGHKRIATEDVTFEMLKRRFPFTTALELIVQSIRGLPHDVQNMLKIASCFGAEFALRLIEELAETYDTADALKIASDH